MRYLLCSAAVVFGGGALHAAGQTLTTEVVADGFARPLYVTHAPGDTERIFVLEQRVGGFFDSEGQIRVLDRETGDVISTFLTVDVSTNNEQGLLGMAFHPDYDENGFFYINYTEPSGDTVIERFEVDPGDPNLADPSSGQVVITISQPFSNHNAGWLEFGPNDGFLYIPTGDGGSGGDPGNRAQDTTNQLLGKMLRLDVDGDDFPGDPNRNYAIPPSNPFVGQAGDDEIWAYGLRNPFRCSFDPETGDLYIADVGQNSREEVDVQPGDSMGGENYGWRCYEGNLAFNTSGCPPVSQLTFPVYDYNHGGGRCSITGGEVYRGCGVDGLQGTYFFADFCSGQIWSLRFDGDDGFTDFQERTGELSGAGSFITSFGRDAFGEIYIVSQSGRISRIVDASGEDGCVDQPCSAADLAAPFGLLDGADVNAFISAFGTSDDAADLNDDGIVDGADVNAFISAFGAGCP